MTDKEIIINGVDITGCYFLNRGITNLSCTCSSEIDEECKYNPNCYYKQLDQLEAEDEELKKNNQILCDLYKNVDSCLQKRTEKFDCYREALEEIEQELKEDIYCESQECGCDDFEECLRCTKNKILDIINKAKENNEDRK